MATRLYFNEGTSAAFSIGAAVSSLWEQNIAGAFTTKKLGTATDGNSNVSHNTSSLGTGVNPCDICFGQFMTDTLPSGVLISGTIQGNMVVREGNTSDNMYTQLGLYVVDSGGALVHTLLGGTTTGGSEANSPSANNRNVPRGGSTAISSYTTVNATSRVVAEVGLRTESTRTTCVGYMYFGGGNGTDLPTGDGGDNSTIKSPWIEFSADIFTPPSSGGARGQAAVAMGFHEQSDPELAAWKRSRSGLYTRRWSHDD
jgi:hypothetical protein